MRGVGGRERSALHAVHIEPAVAVEIDQAHAAREGLGKQALRSAAVVEDEAKSDGLGVIDEVKPWSGRQLCALAWSSSGLSQATVPPRRSASRSASAPTPGVRGSPCFVRSRASAASETVRQKVRDCSRSGSVPGGRVELVAW